MCAAYAVRGFVCIVRRPPPLFKGYSSPKALGRLKPSALPSELGRRSLRFRRVLFPLASWRAVANLSFRLLQDAKTYPVEHGISGVWYSYHVSVGACASPTSVGNRCRRGSDEILIVG